MPERPKGMEWPAPPEHIAPKVGSESSAVVGRLEPEIDLDAANEFMPEGFEIIDPDTMLGRAQLAGMEIHGFASMHLAASNRALWRRVAQLEVELSGWQDAAQYDE